GDDELDEVRADTLRARRLELLRERARLVRRQPPGLAQLLEERDLAGLERHAESLVERRATRSAHERPAPVELDVARRELGRDLGLVELEERALGVGLAVGPREAPRHGAEGAP